jgi:hypothetical protein
MPNKIAQRLAGADRRSIGSSNEVAQEIARDSRLFAQAVASMFRPDPLVRMRAADAVEKATRSHPEMLAQHKRAILEAASIDQQEVRWHIAQMLPRLELSGKQRQTAISILFGYLQDKSSIVRTFAMQALADFALQHVNLRALVVPLLEDLTETGTPAMRSRGRKLLAQFAKT